MTTALYLFLARLAFARGDDAGGREALRMANLAAWAALSTRPGAACRR